jgi:hypothetical protein
MQQNGLSIKDVLNEISNRLLPYSDVKALPAGQRSSEPAAGEQLLFWG